MFEMLKRCWRCGRQTKAWNQNIVLQVIHSGFTDAFLMEKKAVTAEFQGQKQTKNKTKQK